MSENVTITLGPGGLRLDVDGDMAVFARSRVHCIRREGTDVAQLIIDGPPPVPIADPAIAEQIAAWIMGGDLPVGKQGKPAPRADDIGPGSIVDYLGIAYVVSRGGDGSDGIRRWRLSGHTSRGVNESALRLVTPIRVGDHVELDAIALGLVGDNDPPPGSGKITHVARHDVAGHDIVWFVYDIGDVHDEAILHATRTLDDGTVLVVR